MKTLLSCVATPEQPNLCGLTVAADSGMPPLLTELTAHVRARVGEQGWRSTLVNWGDDSSRCFRLYTRRAGERPEDAAWDEIQQNYLSFPDASGACDILEAEVVLQNHNPRWNRMRVGVPAARIGKGRTHDITLRFTGASLSLFVDGVLVDEDWPVGQIPTAQAPLRIGEAGFDGAIEQVTVWPRALSDAAIVTQAGGKARVAQRDTEILGPERTDVQYWTPRGHNQWFGDALLGEVTPFDGDRFRLFYLTDRRHGASKFGCGGHSLAQMSSADLIHWQQHPGLFDIEPWETVGTGRPIAIDGMLLLFYGMHTSRIMPKETIVNPGIDPTHCTIPQPFPEGLRYPQGMSFAESKDGSVFTKSRRLVHPAQNPAICRDETGNGFLLMAGYGSRGLWHSTDLQHWQLIDEAIVPVNNDSPTRNTDECQCMFEWNGWHYIIAGRTGYWMSRQQRGPYWEGKDGGNSGVVKPRWDIYDGLWVPMVATFGNNRRILAGFLQGPEFEWAGHLVFRELVQCEDGTLGTKWPEELTPAVRSWKVPTLQPQGPKANAASIDGTPSSWAVIDDVPASARLSMRIAGGVATSCIGIAVLGNDGTGCALSVWPQAGRVQWSTVKELAIPQQIPTLDEVLVRDPDPIWKMQNPNVPFKGGDFAISRVEGLDQPFQLELLFVYDPKSRSTIIDACINSQRTLITRRKGLIAEQVRLLAAGKCEFQGIRVGELG